jgi:hypothetical protein
MKHIPLWLRPLPIVCLAALASNTRSAETAHAPAQSLVELTYEFGEDVAFESYSVNLTVHHDIDTGSHLLISPIADLRINGSSLTAGLITDAAGYHFKHQRDRETDLGKAITFRMPGTNDDVLAQPKEDALFDRGDEANPFIAVLGPTDWQKGRYTLFVRKHSQRKISGKDYTWIEASLYSHTSGKETYSGSIRFEGTDLTMGGTVSACIQVAEGKTVPTSKITMGGWQVNGEPTIPFSAAVRFPKGAPPRASCKMVAKDVVLVLGPEVNHARNRKLTKTPDGYQQTLFKLKTTPEG